MSRLFGVDIDKMLDVTRLDLWTKENVFNSVLVFMWITFLWEQYLTIRQYNVYKKMDKVPPELAGVLDHETLSKARLYSIDKTLFGLISGTWSQVLSTAILTLNGMPLLWNYSGSILHRHGYQGEILQTLVFVLIGSVFSTVIDLPWSLYSNFVVEEKHGFNKQTLGFYFKDKVKKFVISQLITSPILAAALYIIQWGGTYFFLYLWVFCFVVTIALMTIYPDYIAPLFDKFAPLNEGELRSNIESLAASIDFPLKKLYVVEGSKRSSHSNAYFFGFYKNKRIVLFDTLLEDYVPAESETPEKKEPGKKLGCSNDEVLAILAHELGHWKLNHVLKNLIITEVNLLLCLSVFGLLFQNRVIYQAFGFQNEKPLFIGLLLIFQYIFSPYNEVLSFLMTCLSRHFEFEADAFAKKLNRAAALRGALIKLNKDNLSFPVYDTLYSMWHHSHPPLLERIAALGKID
ncbi:CAAX prenyl protease 1 -like protein [Halotydeus destructor]|nr:CAAX prenyl protease 1 -like protein [Halotydeus destructor]